MFYWFKKKPIIIPLVKNGIKNGLWIECYKGDDTYKKLVLLYGEPLPKQIEVVPYKEEE
jgi:hypothetical protein